jgi:type IV secretory pathway TrbF-like protein
LATTLIGGSQEQPWVSRGAKDREAARFSRSVAVSALAIAAFELGIIGYFGSLPREVPVILAEQRDGSYMPYAESSTPDEAGKVKLIADWFGDFRVGCNDPSSICARQTSALISNTPGDDIAKTVKAYNASIAASGARVSPTIRYIRGSGTEYEVAWDETVTDRAGDATQHAMRAYVTIAFAQQSVQLHTDGLLNPYGLWIKGPLRIIEMGAKK